MNLLCRSKESSNQLIKNHCLVAQGSAQMPASCSGRHSKSWAATQSWLSRHGFLSNSTASITKVVAQVPGQPAETILNEFHRRSKKVQKQ